MTEKVKKKSTNVEDVLEMVRTASNKGIGNVGICTTAANTAAKEVTLGSTFELVDGATMIVTFQNAITVAGATLAVTHTPLGESAAVTEAAKPIYYRGAALGANLIKAGMMVQMRYNGTQWDIISNIEDLNDYLQVNAQNFSNAQKKQARTNINAQELVTDMAKLGCGIGTCSTSSGTALKVVLSGYNLVKSGFVAVTFENDVPAGATLNINGKGAKPIYYKGSAIDADTIKADDTVMFCYDGTNYVVTSLGGGGVVVNPNEILTLSLAQGGGSDSDLTGVAITITDDDSGDTILSTTWQGSAIMQEITVNTNYTVTVGSVTGYFTNTTQSYMAGYQYERNITFTYFALGVYIESTDHNYYTASQWASSGKTANAICLVTSTIQIGIAPTVVTKPFHSSATDTSISNYLSPMGDGSSYLQDYDGEGNTKKIRAFNKGKGTDNTNYAAPYCMEYVFGDGQKGAHVMSAGELNIFLQNKSAINECASIIGLTIPTQMISSTLYGRYSASDSKMLFWFYNSSTITATGGVNLGSNSSILPVKKLI